MTLLYWMILFGMILLKEFFSIFGLYFSLDLISYVTLSWNATNFYCLLVINETHCHMCDPTKAILRLCCHSLIRIIFDPASITITFSLIPKKRGANNPFNSILLDMTKHYSSVINCNIDELSISRRKCVAHIFAKSSHGFLHDEFLREKGRNSIISMWN